jgi:rhodanese-related sulfurtransferase
MNFVINNWYLFLALIVVVYLLASEPAMLKAAGVKLITVQEALRLMNSSHATLVDVREQKEFEQGHIAQCRNIPLGKLGERMGELEKSKSKPVIVICRSGNRSKKGAMMLGKNGFSEVYSMTGGQVAWERDNLPLEK